MKHIGGGEGGVRIRMWKDDYLDVMMTETQGEDVLWKGLKLDQ